MKYAFLIASCCLLTGRLWADQVDYTITDLTATKEGGGPLVYFSGAGLSAFGDSINVFGSSGRVLTGDPISPGFPVRFDASIDLLCGAENCMEDGFASVGGTQFSVLLLPVDLAQISSNTNVTFQPSILTYIIPATATAEFTAVCFGSPNCVNGTLIGMYLSICRERSR